MSERVLNVLFVCTATSSRSIMAEGILNALGSGRFQAYSAGIHPRADVNPFALERLRKWYILDTGYRSKSWNEFSAPGAPAMDLIITLCEEAAAEPPPVWPGAPAIVHWTIEDPAVVGGSDEVRRHAFLTTAIALRRRIELLLAVPMEGLDRLSLLQRLGELDRR